MDDEILRYIADQFAELHFRIRGIRNLLKVSVSETLLSAVLDEPIDRQDPNFREFREIVFQHLQGRSLNTDPPTH